LFIDLSFYRNCCSFKIPKFVETHRNLRKMQTKIH
jgi:hypothetical protein